jgi:hypothetical protein
VRTASGFRKTARASKNGAGLIPNMTPRDMKAQNEMIVTIVTTVTEEEDLELSKRGDWRANLL